MGYLYKVGPLLYYPYVTLNNTLVLHIHSCVISLTTTVLLVFNSSNMTTNSDNLSDDTFVSMDLDPELMFFTWKVGVENYAANKATIVQPTGLLSSILTDVEWQACALNRAHSPGGTLHVALRPAPPNHVPIIAGMTNSAIAVAKYRNDRHQIWHDALASFKTRLIKSLGPTGGHHRTASRWVQIAVRAPNCR
jgi:hypothetical protein